MYKIGLNILNILEMVHDSGYVFNDLKFENILLGDCDMVPDEWTANQLKHNLSNEQLVLTDFGLASRWKDKETGEHLPKEGLKYFGGNMYFASAN